ncbi:hypothetical protein [Asticcacaulis tiandongensis]|uniref:hypothetical protein n=1 Tax=Asticcacaulis tiandongensis TaxID=2565365 RepID=UPI0011278FC2|nr:hypothetical protein [Asticcacaulis tiandongensis]
MLNPCRNPAMGTIMWLGLIHFVSRRALYVATAWLCLFMAHLIAAGCTPEPVMGYAVRVPVTSQAVAQDMPAGPSTAVGPVR